MHLAVLNANRSLFRSSDHSSICNLRQCVYGPGGKKAIALVEYLPWTLPKAGDAIGSAYPKGAIRVKRDDVHFLAGNPAIPTGKSSPFFAVDAN